MSNDFLNISLNCSNCGNKY